MANVAGVPETRGDRRGRAPSARRTIFASEPRSAPFPQEQPAIGVDPLAFRLPMIAAAWFLISMAISFADTIETGYLMVIVIGFGIIFFGLTIGLAMHASGSRTELGSGSSFRKFI